MGRKKFILYTNPNNITNTVYVAYGAEDVNGILKDAKSYPDSCRILYSGRGTDDDINKAKQMFTHYIFV